MSKKSNRKIEHEQRIQETAERIYIELVARSITLTSIRCATLKACALDAARIWHETQEQESA